MMLTFPLPLADFWDRILHSQTAPMVLTNTSIASRTDDGQVFAASRGVSLWTKKVVMGAMPNRAAAALMARVQVMARSTQTFFAYDLIAITPAADTDGLILGAATPLVGGLPASLFELVVKGLPAGYVLTAGDFISIMTASGRRSLVRVVDDTVAAGGAGWTPPFQIEPARLAEVAVDNAVALIKPLGKFIINPGSFDPGTQDGVNTSGASFNITQVVT